LGQFDDEPHLLVEFDNGLRLTDNLLHSFGQLTANGVQTVTERIVEEFRELGILSFQMELASQVGIGDIYHGLVFPYIRTEAPAIDNLYGRETFVGALSID
jgi:hypothetical protein